MGDDAPGAKSDPHRPSDTSVLSRREAIRLAGRNILSGIGTLLSLKSVILSSAARHSSQSTRAAGRMDQPDGSSSPLFAPAIVQSAGGSGSGTQSFKKGLLLGFVGAAMIAGAPLAASAAGASKSKARQIAHYLKTVDAQPPIPSPEWPPYHDVHMPDESFAHINIAWLTVVFVLLAGVSGLWNFGFVLPALGTLLLALAAAYETFFGSRYLMQGFSPRQPIDYSHQLHAGKLGISCYYCHHGALNSDVAGVPSVNVCMNCHAVIHRTTTETQDSPQIAKILAAWESRNGPHPKSIAWNRIHRLPNYVHFSHRVHIANGIRCQECHGAIETMSRVHQAAPLTMGWCIDCHRLNKAQAPNYWKHAGGPTDCNHCHF